MGKKKNFIPKQNTHDLLVGTLSIGIPSYKSTRERVDSKGLYGRWRLHLIDDVQHKNWKVKLLRIWITIIRHGGLGH